MTSLSFDCGQYQQQRRDEERPHHVNQSNGTRIQNASEITHYQLEPFDNVVLDIRNDEMVMVSACLIREMVKWIWSEAMQKHSSWLVLVLLHCVNENIPMMPGVTVFRIYFNAPRKRAHKVKRKHIYTYYVAKLHNGILVEQNISSIFVFSIKLSQRR